MEIFFRNCRRVMTFAIIIIVGMLFLGSGNFLVSAAETSTDSFVGQTFLDSSQTFSYKVTKNAASDSNGEVSVTAAYETRQADDDAYGIFVVPSSVEHNGKTFDVTGIEAGAFVKTASVKAVVLPDSIQKIDSNAFFATDNGGQSADENNFTVYCNPNSSAQQLAADAGCNVKTDGISLSVEKTELTIGESESIKADLADDLSSESDHVEYSSSDSSVVSVDQSGNITAVNSGKSTITANVDGLKTSVDITVSDAAVSNQSASPTVTYQAHIQNLGWMTPVTGSNTAGTTGKALRLEALKISVSGIDNLGVSYRAHVQNKGWMDSVINNNVAGTTGRALRMEAIQIKLTGSAASNYDIYYRVHVQNVGWMAWAKNGATAGTTGYALRMEAIQIVIVSKGSAAPANNGASIAAFTSDDLNNTSVSYQSHIQNTGWQGWVKNGETSGTTGKALRAEAIQVKIEGPLDDETIEYNTYAYDKGWCGWVSNGAVSGTTGEARQMQCVQIKLGKQASQFVDVYYRVHVSYIGWMGWAKNGELAGTTGGDNRIEAIQIKLVKKGGSAPGSTANAYKKIQYFIQKGDLGIDVSEWNGNINWYSIKNSGVKYAFIRTGFGRSDNGRADYYFNQNYAGARAAGVYVGAYHYSYARSTDDARREAQLCISILKGKNLDLPIAFDAEDSSTLGTLSKSEITDIICTFCDTVQAAGYQPMVYANLNWLNNKIDYSRISKYKIWLAQYNTQPTYSNNFDFWQYSSRGQISGNGSQYVDLDRSYSNWEK